MLLAFNYTEMIKSEALISEIKKFKVTLILVINDKYFKIYLNATIIVISFFGMKTMKNFS